ncbi:hypothetical protein HNV10_04315 [Winogradskyella litoriviva]|uniref:Uncharacterized protein n=1 Tax=Winogradskyella litoriviva TaxID=1220182 RepID=A0ABX2E405_9FLAO|nr:hypothetical protein [Winogradskyella litoriviva]NRD22451.1 hypothetical protein [Winogradskyella litoriviva]
MKLKLLILFLFFISFSGWSQTKKHDYKDGYNFISKAEKYFKKNKIIKAEEYLIKARNSNYGFCGNAWAGAFSSIQLLEAEIENKKGNHNNALKILDSINGCSYGADCNRRDVIKIETLFLKHGKNIVINSFKNISEVKENPDDENNPYSVFLKELNYNFTFGGSFTWVSLDENGEPIEQEPTDNKFILIARKYNFYKLIEN